MRVNEKMKKLLSILLCLCMLVQNCPVMAFAATTDNLCEHHTEHTAECGYSEGSAGSACTHEHSEECYAIWACLHTCGDECADGCAHECTVENGCITRLLDCHHTHGDCGYAEAVAPQDCTTCQPVLTHAENCGYVAPVAEVTCACVPGEDGTLVHTENCGYVAPVEEVKCACEPTVTHGGEGCTYAEGKDGSPCTHVCEVKVDSADSCYKLLCSHKDGGHDDACGYVAAVEAHECHYECTECAAAAASEEPSEESSEPTPVCTCAEVCTAESFNEYCDVCGVDYSKCTGTDTAAVYADECAHSFAGGVCDTCGEVAVAKIGDTYYATLAQAAAEVTEGGTIEVLTDVTIGEDETLTFAAFATLRVAEGKTVTCDGTVKIGEEDGIIFENTLYYYGGDVTNTRVSDEDVPTYFKAGAGHVITTYDEASNTIMMVMDNATVTTSDGTIPVSFDAKNLYIQFSGSNTIANTTVYNGTSASSSGIDLSRSGDNYDLTLSGEEDAVLNITAADATGYSRGIYAKSVTITGGTVNITSGNAPHSVCIYPGGTVVEEGATLNLTFGKAERIAIGANVASNEGTVNGLIIVPADNALGVSCAASGNTVLIADFTAVDVELPFTVPAGSTLTVNSGVTVDLSKLAVTDIDFTGTVINNGTILLPEGFGIENAPKGGTVTIGDDSYTWNGEKWICGENNHIGGTATCVAQAVCDICGSSYGELAAHTPDAGGKCTVDGCGYQYAAKVGDTFYETIHKALRAAEGNSGCTLTLLDDITLTSMSSTASYTNQGTFILDLNGKTLSSNKGTLNVLGSADLTIRDSAGGGKIISTYSNAIYQTGGKVTIESGSFEGTLDGVFLSGSSTLIVKGGTFVGSRAMITGFGSDCVIDLTAIDPTGYTLKNNGSGTFAPKLPEGYGMVDSDGNLLASLSAEQSATVHKHEYKYTDLGDGNHQQTCSCGLTTGEPAAHSTTAEGDRAATCKELAYCSVCDSEYGEKNPDNHVSDVYTYTDNGDGTHTKTHECGVTVGEPENHTTEKDENKATCAKAAVCDLCGESYDEVDKTNHDEAVEYVNGFCPYCDAYEPAELVNGVYQISNAGNLYWFADKVTNENETYGSVDAILTADITVNENVLAADGTANAGAFRVWTPIGKYGFNVKIAYTGTFDGNGKTVSGLYFYDTSDMFNVGLFSFVGEGGTVQDVGIADSYLCGSSGIGGVAGMNFGTVTGCHNTGTVSGTNYVGGVVGSNNGTVENCYNSGTVSGSGHSVGGVVGSNDGTVTDCHNTGTVSGDSEVGGVAGSNSGTTMNCYNTGTVSASSHSVGGVVGENLGTATNCYNTGAVSGSSYVGGVAGDNWTTVTNCYNTGTVSGESNVGGVVGWNTANHTATGTVIGCYFDSTVYTGDAIGTNNGTVTNVEGKSTEQFKSGEVAYLLSQGENGGIWGQDLDNGKTKQPAPTFTGAKVSCGYTSCGDTAVKYTNDSSVSPEKPAHTQQPTYTDNGNGTHSASYSCCGTTVTEDHSYENSKCVCGVYDLWVAGEQISESKLTVNGIAGTATYDPATDTLTLNGFDNGDKSYRFTNNGATVNAAVFSMSDLNIVLVGENSLYVDIDSEGYKTAIQSPGRLTIGGEGSLDAGTENWCISAANGMTITGGTLDIFGTTVLDGPATITGGNVSLTANDCVCMGKLTVNGGKVTLSAGSNYIEDYGTIVIGEGMATYDENGRVIEDPDFKKLSYAQIKAAHVHSWSYTAEGDTITAICNGTIGECPDAEQSITISADGKTYDGTPVTATLDGSIDGVAVSANDITYSGNTNAGTYTASITIEGKTASVEFTIDRATPTVAWDNTSVNVNYPGTAASFEPPTVTLVNGERFKGAISYSYTGTSSGNGLPVNAGTYEITASIDAQGNYNAATSTNHLTLTINKVDPVYTVPTGLTATYGDTLADVALPEGFSWTDSSESVGAVGTKSTTVIYTPADTTNYNTVTNIAVSVEVKAAAAIVTAAPTPQRLTYTGEALNLINGGEAEGGEMQYSTDNQNWSTTIPKGTAAGEYTVYYKVVGDENHSDTAVDSVEVTISKAQAVITVDTATITVTYGETVSLPTATTNFGTVVCDMTAGDLVNAGTYTVTYTVAGTANYEGAEKKLTVVVAKKAVAEPTVTGTYTYSGSEHTAQLTGVESCMTVASGNKGTNAGNYEVEVTLDGNHKWAEGSDGRLQWSIDKAKAEIRVNTDPITITYGETVTLPTATTNFGTVVCNKKASDIVNAGTYTVIYTVAGTDNYAGDTKSITVTVNAKPITVTADALSKTYGDADPKLTYKVEGLVNGDKLTGELKRVAGENVGSYAIEQSTLTAGNNYRLTYTGAKLTIHAKAITAADVKLNGSLTYTGEELTQPITVTEGLTYTVTGDKATNVGSYVLTVQGTGNYTGEVKLSWSIQETAAVVTKAPAAKTLTYTGTAQNLVNAGSANGGTMVYSLSENGEFTETIPTGTNAGKYTVWYYVQGDANHSDTAKASVKVTIAKAKLTVTARDNTITYGDVPAANGVQYSGLVTGENETVLNGTLSYGYSYAQFGDVGSYAITPSGLTSNNYEIRFVDGKLTVTQRGAELQWKNHEGRIYNDGQEVSVLITNLVDGDIVEATVAGGKETSVGTHTASIAGLTGEKAGNYTLEGVTVVQTYTIAKAKLQSLTNAPANLKLDAYIADAQTVIGKLPTSVTYTTETGNITVDIQWSCQNYDSTVKKENSFHWTVKDGQLENYAANGIATSGTITVTNVDALPVINSGAAAEITYDGSTYDVSRMFTIDENAGAASYAIIGGTGAGSLNGSILTITRAGTLEIRLTTAAADIYAAGEAAAVLTVKKASGSGTVEISGWTYGQAPNVPTASGTGAVTYRYTGENYSSVAAPTNAGAYTVTATFAATDLYAPATARDTFTIQQAKVTVNVTAADKVYDGTTSAVLEAKLNGVIQGDSIAVEGITAQFSDANAGQNKTVVIDASNAKLTGEKASNYVIDQVNSTTTASITKAASSCTAPAAVTGLTYNGADQALVTAGTAAGGTLVYSLDGETYGETIPTGKHAGAYTVSYKVLGDANHNDSEANAVAVTIGKGTAAVKTIPAQKHFNYVANTNTLDLSEYLPADRGETTYTLDSMTETVFENATAITGSTLSYTTKVTAAAANGDVKVKAVMANYADVTLTVPVELVAVTAQTKRQIVTKELTEVPAGLANNEKLNTLDKIKAEQARVLSELLGMDPENNIAHYDVKLQFSLDGNTWVDATVDTFPREGLTVTLPYPDGTGKDSHEFAVSHLFTAGNQAGTAETPDVTKTDDGIRFTVTGLSPVSVAWSAIPFDVKSSAATGGKVSVDPEQAGIGTQVTITVTPKSGYRLSTLTVKDADGNACTVTTDNNGKYYFTMPAKDVTVTATFSKISTATPDRTNPKTGDDFEVIFWSGMMMTTLLGAAVLMLNRKKYFRQ